MNKKIKKESFMQGVLALMVSQVLIKLLGLMYKLYLTNKEGFGDAGNAIYNSGYQIYALLLTLSSVGVPNAVSKLVSERISLGNYKGAHRIFKIAFFTFALIGLIGASILFFGAGAISGFNGIPEAELTLVALSPSVFFVAIISVFRGYFNGRGSIKTTANSQTLEQLFKTVLTIIIVEIIGISTGLNTTLMAAGANLATTLAIIVSFVYIFTYFRFHRKEIGNEILIRSSSKVIEEKKSVLEIVKNILYVSLPMSLSSILSSINKNVDAATVVNGIKKFASEAEAKVQYGILSGKVDTLGTLPLSFNIAFATALVPAISAAKAKGDMESCIKRISFSILITILIGLPSTIGMFVFAQPILELLFPNAPYGAFVLQICAVAIVFAALIQTINGALQGLGKVFVPAIALLLGVIVKAILNVVLTQIPTDVFIFGGAAGAALATVICQIIAFTIGFTVLIKTVNLKINIIKWLVKPIMATGIMVILSYSIYIIFSGNLFLQIGSYTINSILFKSIIPSRLVTIIALVFAVISYIVSIFILKIFTKEDILMIPYGGKIYSVLEKIGIYKKIIKN